MSHIATDWVSKLADNEDLSIVRGLGSLAFLRAQGRTLEERSQEKYPGAPVRHPQRIRLDRFPRGIRPTPPCVDWPRRSGTPDEPPNAAGTYGQGQKTINVFLKFYVDWASRPTVDVATRMRPWLHCPLDKVVMEALRSQDTDVWRKRMWSRTTEGVSRISSVLRCR